MVAVKAQMQCFNDLQGDKDIENTVLAAVKKIVGGEVHRVGISLDNFSPGLVVTKSRRFV